MQLSGQEKGLSSCSVTLCLWLRQPEDRSLPCGPAAERLWAGRGGRRQGGPGCRVGMRVLGQSCGKSLWCPPALLRPSAASWLVGVADTRQQCRFHHVSPLCQLLVWNHCSLSPVQQYTEHLAAVKAIAWSPHQHGLLASGGGTADRCIRFWNTLTGQPLQCIDTGSQVCNLAWSKHANELVSSSRCGAAAAPSAVRKRDANFPLPFQVSTHGYSQNQILVWKYPSLTQVAKLTGHSYRVLYLVSDGRVSAGFCSCVSAAHVRGEAKAAVPVAPELPAAGLELRMLPCKRRKTPVSGFLACEGCFGLLLWKCEAFLAKSKACQNSAEEAQASLLLPWRLVHVFAGDCQQAKGLRLSVLLVRHYSTWCS